MVASNTGDAISKFPRKYCTCAWIKLDEGSVLSREYALADHPFLPIITIDVSGLLQRPTRLLLANVRFKLKIEEFVSTGGHLRQGCLKLLNFAHQALVSS